MVTPGVVLRSLSSQLNATRVVVSLSLAIVAMAATSVPLFACDIGIKPSSTSGVVGETVTFGVSVQQTHRVCLVPIEDTQFVFTGVELISETAWEQTSSTSHAKQVTVRLVTPGEGSVEVIRECSKGGDRTVAKIAINPAVAVEAPPTPIEPQEEVATPPLVQTPEQLTPATESQAPPPEQQFEGFGVVPTPSAPAAAGTPAWLDSLWQTLQLPYIIVLLSLMAAGTFFLSKGYRKARPFAMLIALGFLGFYIGGCPCPVGSLQNAFIHFRDVTGHMTVYVQFGAVVIVTLLFGRVFCGWGCPLGATQFFLFRKEQSRKNRWLEIPREHHNILRWAKYGVLVALIGLVVLTGQPVFEQVDPFRVLFNLDFRWGVPLVFLIVLVVASVAIGFPFCKYLCPLGAFLGLLQPLALFKIRLNSACTNCKACSSTACDYGAIEPGANGPTINQRECVRCGECLSRCPGHAISFTAARGRR